jgi:two-component system nitrate/nitrite response regulator NarL
MATSRQGGYVWRKIAAEAHRVDILILSAYQLFGECLEQCMQALDDVRVVAVVHDDEGLRSMLDRLTVDLLLVDVAPGFEDAHIESICEDYPGLVTLALGLPEQGADVVRCGRVGFAGYVPRDASLQTLRSRMLECLSGRLTCTDTIAASLLRALRGTEAAPLGRAAVEKTGESVQVKLSAREIGVARLLRRGLSNKEIARELDISVATVKHHVHNILDKLGLPGRVHVARAEPDQSWGLNAPRQSATVRALKRA